MNSRQAISKLDYIDDKELFRSVTMALWLYLDKERTLKYSISKSAEKHGGKKAHIEKIIRSVIPVSLIKSRRLSTQNERDKARSSHVIEWSLKRPH